ncbi:hypothetical protein D3C73_739920 [compost metagenome]
MSDIPAQEHLALGSTELHRSELVAHPVFHNHAAHDACSLLEVTICACSHFADEQFFGYASAQESGYFIQEFLLGHKHAVFLRKHNDISASASARDNRYFVNHIGMLQEVADNGMTCFVVGHDAFLAVADNAAALLGTDDDAVNGFIDFAHADILAVTAGCKEGCFIEQVLQISTGEAGSALRNDIQLNVFGQRLVAGVNLQYSFTAFDIRTVNRDLTVKTSRTKQRRIKNVCAVGSRDDNNTFIAAKAVHFDEQLVEGLLTFVMSAAKSGAALTSDSIDLIDEDNTRSVLLRILEQITHTGCADTDEHFYEVGTGDAEERNTGFTGYCTGQQGFTCTWRAYEKHTFRNTGAYGCELTRIFQEFNNFDKLLLLFVGPCHILEADFLLLFII